MNVSTCHLRESTEKLQDGLRGQIHGLNLDGKKNKQTGKRPKEGSYFSLCRVYLRILDVDRHKHTLDAKQNIELDIKLSSSSISQEKWLPLSIEFFLNIFRYCQSRKILGLSRQC